MQANEPDRATPNLGDRFSRLGEAVLRINEDLDLNTVLQRIVEEACSLTGARYGAMLIFDGSGRIQDLITSGVTREELEAIEESPRGLGLLGYMNEVQKPLRLRDIASHPRSVGIPKNHPPMKTFLGAPVRHRDEGLGNLYLTEKEGGGEFTSEDEETLVIFASQAAMAVINSRRYGDERRARADLAALVELAPVGVLIFDAKTRDLVSRNQETLRIVRGIHSPSRSLPDLLGTMTFRRPDGREIALDELPTERVIRTGETVRADEIVIHLSDGQSVTTVVSATPILSEEGEVVSVVATIQDMTPLEELERLRAEFLGMVSHELRTPLTTIKGSTATALGSSPALDLIEMRQFFKIIDEQADRMRNLISNLLDLTRIEAGIFSVTPEPTGVSDVVEQAKNAFTLGRARNRIEVDIPEDLPRVSADGQRIVQVLSNLFSNASRHSPAPSTIRVAASLQDLHVLITVSDDGGGVSPERLPHLFEKFSLAQGAQAVPDTEATGLGLAICKGIVEAHGGRIWAESDGQGLGARFSLTVPAVEEVVSPSVNGVRGSHADAEQVTLHSARILAVDDEPQVLRHIKRTLSEAGYAPTVTCDPWEVEHLIEMHGPHLILLDLALPGIDGFGLMRRISAITDAPVIFLSGHSEDQVIEKAFEMGAADYVVKPFSPTELVARTRAALRKRASAETPPLEPYVLGNLEINYSNRRVSVAGRALRLTATEYKLLFELSANAGRVLTHDQLLQRVWGLDHSGNPRLVQNFVKTLRRKLGDDAKRPSYIFTEFRVGYRMPRD